ncbi:MAG: OmpA family protein, partial [Sideroxyarcus sp.]|nr:OmpA family protein [Sideroxyarcus sp.]
KRMPWKLAFSISALSLAVGLAWGGDVTVYDKAPSVEELQRQLTGGEGKKKLKTRSIVFGDAPAPQPQEAAPAPAAPLQAAPQQAVAVPQQAQPAPAVAVYAPATPSAPAVARPQSLQVSESAIAFPINFEVNSADILPESIPFIESIAGLLQKDPNVRLLIEGHTDKSGSLSRNTALSRQRAFSVMNYLIDSYRVDPVRLVPVGKGFSEPLGGMEPTNPKNRRVQFRIIG